MILTKEQSLPVPRAAAWAALNDVATLQACVPGCETLTAVGADEFDLSIVAAIGPVKAKFRGKLRIADPNPPESYSIHFEGQGGAAGHGKGVAHVRLEAINENETMLRYSANATVGGRIAQIGARLIDMAAQKLAAEFFAALDQRLRVAAGTELHSVGE